MQNKETSRDTHFLNSKIKLQTFLLTTGANFPRNSGLADCTGNR